MRHPWRIVGLVVGAIVVALLPSSVVIVNGKDEAVQQQAEQFDPTSFVDEIWDSRLLPAFQSDARELAAVLGAVEVDAIGNANKEQLIGVTDQYGTITAGEAHVYLVRGAGTVTDVSDAGIATIQLDGYAGPIEVSMYVGGRIPSDETAVRDAVGFIEFGDFKDQTEYGRVGSAINKRILAEVLSPVVAADLVGRQVSFLGAMGIRTFNLTAIEMTTVRIVPVAVTVGS